MQSQILRELDVIAVNFVNANKKKGAKRAKVQEQMQPKYVKDAKRALKQKDATAKLAQKDELAEFFEHKNNNAKRLEAKHGT